jgi:hypothetical protein
MLPNSVSTASFLKKEERVFAATRLHLDMPSRLAEDGRCVPFLSHAYKAKYVQRAQP